MRITLVLYKQPINYFFRKVWRVQSNKTLKDTGSEKALKKHGVEIIDANEFIIEKKEKIPLQVIGAFDWPIPRDETHPDYKTQVCRVLTDSNVLVEGIRQTQVLLNTVEVSRNLPDAIEKNVAEVPENIHELVKKSILSAHAFDSHQEKLPKRKNPKRPGVHFPVAYGITDVRRNEILSNKLLNILERCSNDTSKRRAQFQNLQPVASFKKDNDLIQLKYTPNILITTEIPLKPIMGDVNSTESLNFPDISPIKHTVTIPKQHFYDFSTSYPLDRDLPQFHPHTVFSHLSLTKTHNIHETPVTEEQIEGKTLLHAFTTAYAYAKAINGDDVETLKNPVTVQCIHTDSKMFYLGVLQLNTLNIHSNNNVKNVWYSKPALRLFKACSYTEGKPKLVGYNPEVLGYLQSMYDQ